MNPIEVQRLLDHVGHDVEIVTYENGDKTIADVSLECRDCDEVINGYDFNEGV